MGQFVSMGQIFQICYIRTVFHFQEKEIIFREVLKNIFGKPSKTDLLPLGQKKHCLT